jgi:hypothetical protein
MALEPSGSGGGLGPWGSFNSITSVDALERQIHADIEADRHASYELMPLATEGMVQGKNGLQLFIPYFDESAGENSGGSVEDVAAITVAGVQADGSTGLSGANDQPGLPLGSDNVTFSLTNFRTLGLSDLHAPITYYADGFRMTKPILRATGSGEEMYRRGIERLARYISKTHEESLQRQFYVEGGTTKEALLDVNIAPTNLTIIDNAEWNTAGFPMLVMPRDAGGGALAAGNLTVADVPTANQIALVRNRLKRNNNPTFKQLAGNYAGIIGPDTEYYLLNHVTGETGWAALTFEQESMSQAEVYKNGKVPTLFKVAMICSNAIPIGDGTFTNGLSGGTTGDDVDYEINMFFAPDAIYKIPSAALPPDIHVVAPTASVADPTASNALVATDFGFQSLRGPHFEEKAVVMPAPVLS